MQSTYSTSVPLWQIGHRQSFLRRAAIACFVVFSPLVLAACTGGGGRGNGDGLPNHYIAGDGNRETGAGDSYGGFTNTNADAAISGNVVLTKQPDRFESNIAPSGYVHLEGGDDEIVITGGTWTGYHSHGGDDHNGDCGEGANRDVGCIYGGGGNDDIAISGGATFGSFINTDTWVDITGNVVMIGTDGNQENYFESNVALTDGHVDMGAGDDDVKLTGGLWGYHSGDGGSGGDCETTKTDGCIYGSGGVDDINTQGSAIFSSFVNTDTEATITGNVAGTSRGDYFASSGGTYNGHVDLDTGNDEIIITGGTWANYYGGESPVELADRVAGTIYAGDGEDEFTLSGTGAITGNIIGDDDYADTITINGGSVGGYIDGGGGDDTIHIGAGTWAGYQGDPDSGHCGSSVFRTAGCIYGGAGVDTFILSGANTVITGDVAFDGTIDIRGGRIDGNIIANAGDNEVTLGDTFSLGGYVDLGAGMDTLTVNAGTWAGYHGDTGGSGGCAALASGGTAGCIYGGAGVDRFILSDGTINGDIVVGSEGEIITITGGMITGNIIGGGEADTITFSGATLTGDITGDGGVDIITITGGTIDGNIMGGSEGDTISFSGATLTGGDIDGGAGGDEITITGGMITGNIMGGDEGDTISFSGDTLTGDIDGGDGVDTITITGGAIDGDIEGGSEGDTISFSGATLTGGDIDGGAGSDEITITSGMITGNIMGGSEDDTISFSGDALTGDITGDGGVDIITITGGTIDGNIMGGSEGDTISFSGATLTGGDIDGGAGGDEITITGGMITGNIMGGSGVDTITINGGTLNNGYISGGGEADKITIGGGTWTGYHSDMGSNTQESGDYIEGACRVITGTPGATDDCIYGGAGNDSVVVESSATFQSFYHGTGTGTFGTFGGALVLADTSTGYTGGYFEFTGDGSAFDVDLDGNAITTYIRGGNGADSFSIRPLSTSTLTLTGYHGGTGDSSDACGVQTSPADGCIYGGAGEDRFSMTHGTIGFITGDNDAADIIILTGTTVSNNVELQGGDDIISIGQDVALSSGYIDMGAGDDTITATRGAWEGYHSGDGATNGECSMAGNNGCIYGGAEDDYIHVGEGPSTDSTFKSFIIDDSGDSVGGVVRLAGGGFFRLATSGGDFGLRADGMPTTTAAPGTFYVNGYASYVRGSSMADDFTLGKNPRSGAVWTGYHGGGGVSGGAKGTCTDALTSMTNTNGDLCIYGRGGADSFTISGGTIGFITGQDAADVDDDDISLDGGTVSNSTDLQGIDLQGGRDRLQVLSAGLSTATVHGSVDMGAHADEVILDDKPGSTVYFLMGTGADRIIITGGEWTGYHGGDGGDGDCPNNNDAGCIYGNGGTDTLILESGDIGPVIGADGEHNNFVLGEDGPLLDYVLGGNGNDVVRILDSFSAQGGGGNIQFSGDCLPDDATIPATAGDQWICGGGGTGIDTIEYASGVTALTSTQTDITNTCTIGTDCTSTFSSETATSETGFSEFAFGFEQAGVSPDLGLWGGLSSALQSFGRAMMEDFTASPAVPHVIQSEAKNLMPQGTAHLFSGTTQSFGPFHAREVQLRGESTSHLTLTGVPGAVGTSSYQHDVNLVQQGFSTQAAQGLVAQGGFHLMQGNLTSSDDASQFSIEGYGAGAKLAYGGADVAMLGAWFDLASDDWGKPMDFSGTQWVISSGIEREVVIGGLSIIPQARGFWQRTNIEDQGAIRFSDELIFTGKAGLAIESGIHAFDVFFIRDDKASSLNTGLIQNHRMEEAIEAGWRSYGLSNGFSVMGELRYRHGLETGMDSYSAGVALTRAF